MIKGCFILYAVPISLWLKLGQRKPFFILGTLTIMTVDLCPFPQSKKNNIKKLTLKCALKSL